MTSAIGLRLAVLGGGPIGAGIAALGLVHGATVALWSRREETRQGARAIVERVVASRARRGTLTEHPSATLERFCLPSRLADAVAEADWVVEAVVEDLAVKRTLLGKAEGAAPPYALISTSGSWIPVSEVASGLRRGHGFMSTHFYNPPWERWAVEMTPGQRTSPETVQTLDQWLRQMGQTPALLNCDNPGFAGNRFLFRQLEGAMLAVHRGTPPQAVDAAYRQQLGFPVGPCEAMDYVGLDFMDRLLNVAVAWGWDPPPEAGSILREKVARGEVGAPAGEGFYPYPSRRWELHSLGPEEAAGVDAVALFAPSVLEAARLVRSGIATPEVVDTVARGAVGWREGPIALGRRLGRQTVQDALRERYQAEPSRRYHDDGSLEAVLT